MRVELALSGVLSPRTTEHAAVAVSLEDSFTELISGKKDRG